MLSEGSNLPIQGVSIDWDKIVARVLQAWLGIPGAEILSFDEGQVHPIDYEDTDSYQITKMFIENRELLLERLLQEE